MTASVQGHNINVYKIMPGYDRVSASDAGSSYVHLYRLQRGITNAVSFPAQSFFGLIHAHFYFQNASLSNGDVF